MREQEWYFLPRRGPPGRVDNLDIVSPRTRDTRGARRLMPTYLDLFAGAGGFSLGLSSAGLDCVGVVENDLRAADTYRLNFPGHIAGAPLVRLGPDEGDVSRIEPEHISDVLNGQGIGEGELDLLVAGPPCQGFSHIGRSKLDSLASQRGAFQHDERNQLYLNVTNMLPVLRPRCFLIENVPGILTHARVNVAERIAETAEGEDYRVAVAILNAAWYGVPQTRERVFVLGYREDLGVDPTFPAPTFTAPLTPGHLAGAEWVSSLFNETRRFTTLENPGSDSLPAATVSEAIGDLPTFTRHLENGYRAGKAANRPLDYPATARPGSYDEMMRVWPGLHEPGHVRDHYVRYTPRDHETFRRMRHGDRYPAAVRIARQRYVEAALSYRSLRGIVGGIDRPRREDFVPPYPTGSFDEKWRKLVPDLPAWTVTAHLSKDGYSHIHYDGEQARSISPREAARLQGFPDAFAFEGNMGDAFRQIGNAVPPILARELGRHVAETLGTVDGAGEDEHERASRAPAPVA